MAFISPSLPLIIRCRPAFKQEVVPVTIILVPYIAIQCSKLCRKFCCCGGADSELEGTRSAEEAEVMVAQFLEQIGIGSKASVARHTA